MSILDNIFGKKSMESSNLNWNLLSEMSQIDNIIEKSNVKPQVLFKHSTRCGISSGVLRRFEKEFDTSINMELYFLDLLRYRNISNEIADRFNIVHQSPQLIVIKNGVVVAHDSHYDLMNLDLKNS